MQAFASWFVTNWSYILSGICVLIFMASVIVKLTPTTKDDKVLGKIIKVLDKLSVVKTANDKAMIERAKKEIEDGGGAKA